MTKVKGKWEEGLFPYQVDAIQFLLQNKKAILRLDTGLGKTATCVRYAEALAESMGDAARILIVCPAFLKWNWEKEIAKWQLTSNVQFELHSYHKFSSNNFNSFSFKTRKECYSLVVCDEAHYLKSWSSNRTKALCKSLLPKCERVVFSTATPYVRSAEDLHPLYSVCQPGEWGKFGDFRKKFCKSKPNPFSSFRGAVTWYGVKPSTAPELNTRSSKFTFFRRKQEVENELPEKLETDIILKTPERLLKANIDVDESIDWRTGNVKGGLSSVLTTELKKLGEWKAGEAVEWVRNFESTRPLVIFCKHKDVAAGIQNLLGDNHPVITGDTPMSKRQSIVEEFQAGKRRRLICTIGSSGVGINLHTADTALFVELPWSYTELKQCEDRLHRIGQKNAVSIYRMYAEGSLDDLVVEQISQKFEGETISIGGWDD